MTKRKMLSRSDLFHIGKVLEGCLSPDGERETDGTKYVKFKEGWDDERVATITGATVYNVQSSRRELFGQIRNVGGTGPMKTHELRLDSVVARIEAIEKRLDALEDAATKPRVVKSFSELPSALNGPKQ